MGATANDNRGSNFAQIPSVYLLTLGRTGIYEEESLRKASVAANEFFLRVFFALRNGCPVGRSSYQTMLEN